MSCNLPHEPAADGEPTPDLLIPGHSRISFLQDHSLLCQLPHFNQLLAYLSRTLTGQRHGVPAHQRGCPRPGEAHVLPCRRLRHRLGRFPRQGLFNFLRLFLIEFGHQSRLVSAPQRTVGERLTKGDRISVSGGINFSLSDGVGGDLGPASRTRTV